MFSYEVSYHVPGSGAGMIKEVVRAASDYNARRIIEARFPDAQIFSVRRVG